MGCVQAKPLESEANYSGLDSFKMENGYVPSSDFVAHRRSTGQSQKHVEKGKDIDHHVHQRQPRKHKVVDGNCGGRGKRDAELKDSKKQLNRCFDDEMVDGWPKWLVDNVPSQVLAGVVAKSAESYKMIDKVRCSFFISQTCWHILHM
jgi:cyclin-dependent kinase 12/13